MAQLIGLYVSLTFLLKVIQNPIGISVIGCGFSCTIEASEWIIAPYLISVSIPFLGASKKGRVLFGVAVLLNDHLQEKRVVTVPLQDLIGRTKAENQTPVQAICEYVVEGNEIVNQLLRMKAPTL